MLIRTIQTIYGDFDGASHDADYGVENNNLDGISYKQKYQKYKTKYLKLRFLLKN